MIPRYTPRFFGRLDTVRFPDWAIKVYGISIEAADLTSVKGPMSHIASFLQLPGRR
jgi:hypothetical protein